MAVYKLEVTTGDMKHAGTMDNIYITLFGTEGQSDRTNLDNLGIDFKSGKVRYIQSNNVYKIGVGGGLVPSSRGKVQPCFESLLGTRQRTYQHPMP